MRNAVNLVCLAWSGHNATYAKRHCVKSGRCIDADLNTIGGNGTRVQLWDCNSQPQQDWRALYF